MPAKLLVQQHKNIHHGVQTKGMPESVGLSKANFRCSIPCTRCYGPIELLGCLLISFVCLIKLTDKPKPLDSCGNPSVYHLFTIYEASITDPRKLATGSLYGLTSIQCFFTYIIKWRLQKKFYYSGGFCAVKIGKGLPGIRKAEWLC